MTESELELKVRSAMKGANIVSESQVYIESNNINEKEALVDLAKRINEKITERHSNYLTAKKLGYYVYPIRKLEIRG